MARANATLSLGSDSVTIPLLAEGGTPLVSSDLGKPEVNVRQAGGSLFPRTQDQWSGLQNITLVGRFVESDAYTQARQLIDIVESDFGSDELRVTIDLPEYDDNLLVALGAGQESACTVSYPPGRKNFVDVELSLTRVGRVAGTGDRDATTPTDTGSGPIELRAGGSTVELVSDVSVTRSCGRPNDVIRRQPQRDLPYYINKQKAITEQLALEFEITDDPVGDFNAIAENIFRQRLGRQGVTLDFNGVYGLGEFEVLPVGSAPFRQARRAGREGMARVPTLEFRRVLASQ